VWSCAPTRSRVWSVCVIVWSGVFVSTSAPLQCRDVFQNSLSTHTAYCHLARRHHILRVINFIFYESVYFIYLSIHSCKNDNKIKRNTIHIKANATVRQQGISLTDAFITNISTVTVTYNIVKPVLGLCDCVDCKDIRTLRSAHTYSFIEENVDRPQRNADCTLVTCCVPRGLDREFFLFFVCMYLIVGFFIIYKFCTKLSYRCAIRFIVAYSLTYQLVTRYTSHTVD